MKVSIWDILLPKYTWVAKDSDDRWFAFIKKPTLNSDGDYIPTDLNWDVMQLKFTDVVELPEDNIECRPKCNRVVKSKPIKSKLLKDILHTDDNINILLNDDYSGIVGEVD